MLKWTCQSTSSTLVITAFRPWNVWDLRVVFDHHMTMHENITKTCASCYFHLRNISSIRDSLTDEATIQLVHAFVSSRIDYCNSLLYGIPEYAIKRLQRVQNLAARVVTRSSKYSSITPTLKKLHWLPVKYRIIFKVVLLTFKALHGRHQTTWRLCCKVTCLLAHWDPRLEIYSPCRKHAAN